MGIFWDLMQQEELDKQQAKAETLEGRIAALENELKTTKNLLRKTLIALEEHLNRDIDNDGITGA